jgi:hypothetical protein
MANLSGASFTGLPKQLADRIGRNFNLLFNRALMYSIDHPSTIQSISDFYSAITEGLSFVSPLTIIMDRNHVFIEEEALDPRVNPFRIVAHFKKGGIKSISFEKGLKERELSQFMKVLINQKLYPTAEAMKGAIKSFGVQNILINHIVYKKVAADERVVSKKEGYGKLHEHRDLIRTEMVQKPQIDKTLNGKVKKLTLDLLLKDPSWFLNELLGETTSIEKERWDEWKNHLSFAVDQIKGLRKEIIERRFPVDKKGLEEVFSSITSLKKELLKGISEKSTIGLKIEETDIIQEIDNLSDQVILELLKEEYRKGEVSVKRLGQIIRRMIPDVRELKRLLPKIKEALIEEGMTLSDYLELIKELGKELYENGVVSALQEGAIEIGISAEDLVEEIKRNPGEAAELITLAAEIRSMRKGDEKLLTEILVEYVEKVSAQIALDEAEKEGPEGGKRLRDIIDRVEQELVERLREINIEAKLIDELQVKLMERSDEKLYRELKSKWILRKIDPSIIDQNIILNLIRSSFDEDEDVRPVIELIKSGLESKGLDRARIKEIYDAIYRRLEEEEKIKGLIRPPKGALTRNQLIFILQGEIKKAARYPYPVSALVLRIGSIKPKKLVPIGSIQLNDIIYGLLERLVKIKRDVDYAGSLDEEKVILIMPFTDKKGAHLAKDRIVNALLKESFIIKGVPLDVEIIPSTYSLEPYHRISVKGFIQAIEERDKGQGE